MKQVVVVADHGVDAAALTRLVRKLSGLWPVETVAWPGSAEDLQPLLGRCADRGATELVLFPLAMMPAPARLVELGKMADRAAPGGLRVTVAPSLGYDRQLLDMVRSRLHSVLASTDGGQTVLTVGGTGLEDRAFSYRDLRALPHQIPDVEALAPDREGQGVWMRALLETSAPGSPATRLSVLAGEDGFSASVPVEVATARGFLIYSRDDAPLPASLGGPARLMIPGYDDRCANVKGVRRIELS